MKKQGLFQAKINPMLDVSSTRLFTLHSPLFTFVSGKRLVTWSHSFDICAKINEMLDVSITKLFTLH